MCRQLTMLFLCNWVAMIQNLSDRISTVKYIDLVPCFHGIHKWHQKMSARNRRTTTQPSEESTFTVSIFKKLLYLTNYSGYLQFYFSNFA